MQQDTRTETRKRLDDEERIKRMQEGGEDMRAQLAMEEAERSRGSGRVTGLTPEEEERRRAMETGGYIPGMGETQQAQMAMWGKEKQGTERPLYPAGTGGHYPQQPNISEERASTGEPFTSGPELRERPSSAERGMYPAGTGGHYPSRPDAPEYSASTGEPFTGGPGLQERPASRERMPPEGGRYPAGTGSYYSGRYDGPIERASSGEPFTGGAAPGQMSGGQPQERGMYPAGTGGHYQRYPDAPAYRASSGESFTGGAPFHEGQPSEQVARSGVDASRAEAYPSQEPAPTNKMAQKAAVAGATVKETGAGVASKTRDYGERMTEKVREYDKSGRAEETANRAGESIGRAIRKALILG